MSNIFIYNNTQTTKTYQSQEILSNQYYTLLPSELNAWNSDLTVLTDICLSTIIISTTNSNTGHLTPNAGINLLKDVSTVKTTSVPAQLDKVKVDIGQVFTATNSTTTTNYMSVPFQYLSGGRFETENNTFGDIISFAIVDKDNLLGYGVDFVLSPYMTNCPVPKNGIIEERGMTLSNTIPSGMYLKSEYVSTGGTDVKCGLTLFGYNDV